mmetsp:Transcript_44398/g.117800  ORF Transcript_44398/g.117800 Transcript_44398/m.117800 type:complete len:494 (+) Transcript_44398:1218-2699(+)
MHQIAQVVREFRVVHQANGLVTEADVLAEGRLATEVPPQCIARKAVQLVVRTHHVSIALGHLTSVRAADETVDHDALRQRDLRAHENRRPDNGVEPSDVLADNVHVRGPIFAERIRCVKSIDTSEVVRQRIKPYIHDVLGAINEIFGALDTPGEGTTTDAQVSKLHPLETFDELQAVPRRLDKLLVLLKQLQDGILVLAKSEEETWLRHLLQWRAGARILEVPLHGLGVCYEPFLAHQIPTFVLVEVNIAIFLALRPHFPRDFFVVLARGANVLVVGAVQSLIQGFESIHVPVDELLRRDAFGLRDLRNLQAVLISACHEEHILAIHTVVTCEGVRRQHLVSVTYVRPTVRVVDGGGNIVLSSNYLRSLVANELSARTHGLGSVGTRHGDAIKWQRLLHLTLRTAFQRLRLSCTCWRGRFRWGSAHCLALKCRPCVMLRLAGSETRHLLVPTGCVRKARHIRLLSGNLRKGREVFLRCGRSVAHVRPAAQQGV